MSHQGHGRTTLALVLLIGVVGSGCGQKGPLFLPSTNGSAGAAAGGASAAGVAAGSASAARR